MRLSDLYTGFFAALSAIIAILCCISPLILAMLGLGSAVAAATLMRFQWVFVAVAAAAVLMSYLSYRSRKRRCAIEGRAMPAGRFTAVMLYFSALLISVLALGLIFPAITYNILKVLLG